MFISVIYSDLVVAFWLLLLGAHEIREEIQHEKKQDEPSRR